MLNLNAGAQVLPAGARCFYISRIAAHIAPSKEPEQNLASFEAKTLIVQLLDRRAVAKLKTRITLVQPPLAPVSSGDHVPMHFDDHLLP
jgi:hypothetical protein